MSKSRNTPLLWGTPPGSLLRKLYDEARASIAHTGGATTADVVGKQAYLRKVADAYSKRLIAAGIYVEGLS